MGARIKQKIQYDVGIRTRSSLQSMTYFADWFDSSVIRKASGEPLLVYHGSPNPGFEEFRLDVGHQTGHEAAGLGVWFTTSLGVASKFAFKWRTEYEETGEIWGGQKIRVARDVFQKGRVYACYLKMLNPAWYGSDESDGFEDMMDDRDAFASYNDTLRRRPTWGYVRQGGRMLRAQVAPPGHWRKGVLAYDAPETNIDFRMYLEALGHDGIVIQNTVWDSVQE
ncbi:hypothetical protein LCGC14_2554850, partial [marine sediment metagenome]